VFLFCYLLILRLPHVLSTRDRHENNLSISFPIDVNMNRAEILRIVDETLRYEFTASLILFAGTKTPISPEEYGQHLDDFRESCIEPLSRSIVDFCGARDLTDLNMDRVASIIRPSLLQYTVDRASEELRIFSPGNVEVAIVRILSALNRFPPNATHMYSDMNHQLQVSKQDDVRKGVPKLKSMGARLEPIGLNLSPTLAPPVPESPRVPSPRAGRLAGKMDALAASVRPPPGRSGTTPPELPPLPGLNVAALPRAPLLSLPLPDGRMRASSMDGSSGGGGGGGALVVPPPGPQTARSADEAQQPPRERRRRSSSDTGSPVPSISVAMEVPHSQGQQRCAGCKVAVMKAATLAAAHEAQRQQLEQERDDALADCAVADARAHEAATAAADSARRMREMQRELDALRGGAADQAARAVAAEQATESAERQADALVEQISQLRRSTSQSGLAGRPPSQPSGTSVAEARRVAAEAAEAAARQQTQQLQSLLVQQVTALSRQRAELQQTRDGIQAAREELRRLKPTPSRR
jgi:hypothetical protein